MANYELKQVVELDCCVIVETQTDYPVRAWENRDLNKKVVKKVLRWLNSGGAFAGFTPYFFARHIPLIFNLK